MTGNIATTLFQTGPKDDLAVVDVYSVTDTKVKTSLIDRLQNTAGNIVNKIVANPDLLMTVASALTNKGGAVAFDKNDLLDALSSTSMGYKARSMVSGFTENISSSIGNTLTKLTGNPRLSYGVMTAVEDVVDNMTYDDLSSSQNLIGYLGNLTGNLNIGQSVGLDAEYATLATFITEAIGVGSVGAFETMIDAYSGRSDYNMVVRGVMRGTFEQAARSGNLKMIEKMVDKIGGEAVLSETPNAVNLVIGNYTFPKKIKSKDYLEELDKLKGVLVKIDPQWNTATRTYITVVANENVYNDQPCKRIDVFEQLSPDSRELFMLDVDNKINVIIAKSYSQIDCKSNIREKYPKAYFK